MHCIASINYMPVLTQLIIISCADHFLRIKIKRKIEVNNRC
jgi:hypothetical protein